MSEQINKIQSNQIMENPIKFPQAMPDIPAVYLVFYLFLDSLNIAQQGIGVTAKEIKANASGQTKIQSLEEHMPSPPNLPSNAGSGTIHKVQAEIEQQQAAKQNFQNQELKLRQEGQLVVAQAHTEVDGLQQYATINSSYLGTLDTLLEAIQQMSPIKLTHRIK